MFGGRKVGRDHTDVTNKHFTTYDTLLNLVGFSLLGKYPNTYVFTKAIAENVVKEEGKHLPIGIIRPSISKFNHPIPSFVKLIKIKMICC